MRKLWHSLIRGLGLNNGPRNGFHFCDLASDGQVVHSFAFFTTLSLYSNLPGLPPRVTLPEKNNSRVGILAITLSSDNMSKVVASI